MSTIAHAPQTFRRDGVEHIFGNRALVPVFGEISLGVTAGISGSWSSWIESVPASGAQELNFPFLLTSIAIAHNVGQSLSADGTVGVQKRLWAAVGKGDAGSEVEVARTMIGSAIQVSVTGHVDDPITASGICMLVDARRLAPVMIPPHTRISVRLAQLGLTSERFHQVYISGYDASDLPRFSEWPLEAEMFRRGVSDSHEDDLPDFSTEITATAGAAFATPGSWVDVVASLPANYLITEVNAHCDPAEASSLQDAHIAVGTGSAGAEIERGKVGFPTRSLAPPVWSSNSLPIAFPFIAFEGERLAVRVYGNGSRTKIIRIEGIKLNRPM